MTYHPQKHHRRSIRLKGYDYAQAGLYFITICCQNRAHLFGQVEAEKMVLNAAGRMVVKWYNELKNKFPDIRCDEMVVMPNHFHCILENVGADGGVVGGMDGAVAGAVAGGVAVGADLRVCPLGNGDDGDDGGEHVGSPQPGSPQPGSPQPGSPQPGSPPLPQRDILGEHVGSPLYRVIQWFKTMTTNEYIRGVKTLGWPRFNGKLWQRNYWEHIIRNENEYHRIAQYIRDNPKKWYLDQLNRNDNRVMEDETPYNPAPWMI